MKITADATKSLEESIEIAASPEAVYDLVSDITRMGEWSPVATGGRWIDGGTGAEGDWFIGTNETAERSWERDCQIARAERGSDFTFVVGGVDANCTWWSYEMEPTDAGTKLTERWWFVNMTPGLAAALEDAPEGAIDGFVANNAESMRTTLAGLKAAAEG